MSISRANMRRQITKAPASKKKKIAVAKSRSKIKRIKR
jgi:hypothetical protein